MTDYNSDNRLRKAESWVEIMINEYNWSRAVAWEQAAIVLAGVRDVRMHDNGIMLLDMLD